jgi:integrase
MSYHVADYVVRVHHVEGCRKVRCGPRCARQKDGYEYRIRIRSPDGESFEERRRVPLDAATYADAVRWTREYEAVLIRDGVPFIKTAKMTLAELVQRWLDEMSGCDMDPCLETYLRLYVLPYLGTRPIRSITRSTIKNWLLKLRERHSRRGGTLAPRTIRKAYSTVKQVFAWAVGEKLLIVNPVVATPRVLPVGQDKDPRWRRTARCSEEEVMALCSSPQLTLRRRVANGLDFLTGMRPGESAAVRWQDWITDSEPLRSLIIAQAYSTQRRRVKGTKTGPSREIPVHPLLDALLQRWWDTGWRDCYGREPTASDLILPSRSEPTKFMSSHESVDAFQRDLKRLGLRTRRHYDTRRTFISILLDNGAPKEDVRKLTHPSFDDSVDLYYTPVWKKLCDAVLVFPLRLPDEGAREGRTRTVPVSADVTPPMET